MFLRLFKEGFLFAINSIFVNKLRTFLSLFGITIGIFSIISVLTVLDWLEKSIHDNISSMGADIIHIEKGPWSFDPNIAWWDIMKWPSVSKEDFQALQNKSTKAEYVCFYVTEGKQVKFKRNAASDIRIKASTYNFINTRNFEIDNGRYFSNEESASGKNVAIIGSVLAERLFEKSDPVGKYIAIAGKKTSVIGVFKKEGNGGFNESLDENVLVPLNFGKSFINMKYNYIESTILIKAKDGVLVQDLSDETKMILRASRRLHPADKDNFSVNLTSMLTQGFDAVFVGINLGGWVIGGFAILVGGFGIANIMFVSVRERTNIIGIQKALGAKRFFILQQFLVESVILSIIGGLLGVVLIFIGTLVINYLYNMHMYLTLGNIFLAIFISGLIGVVAGYAPANSAAKMNPVEAIGFSF